MATHADFTMLVTSTDQGTYIDEPITNNGTESAIIDYWQRVIVATIYLSIFICGIVGNSMVICAVILSRKLREPTNCLITNLAASDLLTCTMLIWNVVALLSKSGWPIGGWVCTMAGTIIYSSSGTSLFNLAVIAVNRLIRIIKPNIFNKIYTYRNVAIMITFTWIIPLPFILIPPLIGIGKIGYDPEDFTCSDMELHPRSDTFNYFQSAIVPIPLFTIIFCYGWILLHIRRHFKIQRVRQSLVHLNRKPSSFRLNDSESKPPDSPSSKLTFSQSIARQLNNQYNSPQNGKIDNQQLAVTMNLFYVVVAFLVCSLPYFFALLFASSMNTDHFMLYAGAILLASSAINPAIYAWKHPHFKVALKAMILCRYHEIPQPSSTAKRVITRVAIELPSSSFPSRSNSKSLPSRPSFRKKPESKDCEKKTEFKDCEKKPELKECEKKPETEESREKNPESKELEQKASIECEKSNTESTEVAQT